MQNIKIEYVNGALVALERDGVSYAHLPVSAKIVGAVLERVRHTAAEHRHGANSGEQGSGEDYGRQHVDEVTDMERGEHV